LNKAEGAVRRITPVILSGGSGKRLWPLSSHERPKQMLDLCGEQTMLQMTAARVSDNCRFEPPILVTAAAQGEAAEGQIRDLGIALPRVILEPSARNTAPAIALAALAAADDELLLVMPSDHLIGNDAAFLAAIEAAAPLAEAGWLITFGVRPSRVETGYGYIKRGDSIASGVFRVDRFVEKPDTSTATAYLEAGGYDWNAGIFLFRADTFLSELRRHAGDIEETARLAMEMAVREGALIHPNADHFRSSRSESVDRALMEHAGRVAVVPVDMDWSDVGSWQALYEVAEKDSRGNVASGSSVLIDTSNCLIRSEGPVVAAIGVHDLVVVATERAVLIVPRSESQRVPEVLAMLAARGEPQT
jgi:mannose-1-phosphate guanylyltransferase